MELISLFFSKKFLEESATDLNPYRKNFKISVFFLLFFIVTESLMSWDWFMSMTPHWYSTLFAWYVFASMFVSAITVIALVTIYLKSKGLVSFINDSHFMIWQNSCLPLVFSGRIYGLTNLCLFGMLICLKKWSTLLLRIQEYNLLFFGMLVLNFVFPILILMNSDFKRVPWFIVIAGIAILVGHYIDIFLLVMPSTVGVNWSFGITEIASIAFFLGLFILCCRYRTFKSQLTS